MSQDPNPFSGLEGAFDVVGLPTRVLDLALGKDDPLRNTGLFKTGDGVNNLNDVLKIYDHATGAFAGDPKAAVDLVGDLGGELGKALKHAPELLKSVGGVMERAGKRFGLGPLEQFGKEVFAKSGSKIASALGGAETPIIDAGLMSLTLMGTELGFGDPDTGDRFGDGATGFHQVAQTLESAYPDDNWQGSGSQAYTRQNTRQQDRAETMAHADNELHGIIQNEARELTETQKVIDVASDVLSACIPIAIGLYALGPEVSFPFQTGAVAGAMPLPTARMAQMAFQAMQNAAKVQQVIGMYSEVAAGAHPTGAPSSFSPPAGTPGSTPPSQAPEPSGRPGGSGSNAPGGTGSGGNGSGGGQPGDTKPGGTQPGDTKPGDTQPGGTQPGTPASGPHSGGGAPAGGGAAPSGGGAAPSSGGGAAPSGGAAPAKPSAPTAPDKPSTGESPSGGGTPESKPDGDSPLGELPKELGELPKELLGNALGPLQKMVSQFGQAMNQVLHPGQDKQDGGQDGGAGTPQGATLTGDTKDAGDTDGSAGGPDRPDAHDGAAPHDGAQAAGPGTVTGQRAPVQLADRIEFEQVRETKIDINLAPPGR